MSWSRNGAAGWLSGNAPQPVRGDPNARAALGETLADVVQVARPAAPAPGEAPFALDGLRQLARDAYARGAVDEAREAYARAMAAAEAAGQVVPDDHLFMGLVLFAQRRLDEAIATLTVGAERFPAVAAIHENLAVLLMGVGRYAECVESCEEALRRGSDSPNVHDCLADVYNRIGRIDLAVESGRRALAAKDARFGAGPRIAQVPDGMPPPFDPSDPSANVVAYCLWGNEARYQVPLLENAKILPHLFPGWTMRLYHDQDVDRTYLGALRERGVDLRASALPYGVPGHRRLLWRFEVVADPAVKRFLCRDADSLLTVKERVAVDAWLRSPFWFHAMRDWYTHTDLLLAGMWGGVGGILPDTAALLRAYSGWRVEHDHIDQDVLAEAVWPVVRGKILIHDSVFAPCLGSVPFPPFGALPPGHHIGQNAFLHFTRAG